jgi:hypothetical protein
MGTARLSIAQKHVCDLEHDDRVAVAETAFQLLTVAALGPKLEALRRH